MLLSKIGGGVAHALGRMTATSESKILAVISSASAPDLKDGKTYSTGYYLNEPVIPYRKLLEAGYDPVIANPKDNRPRTLITGLHEPRCP